MSPLAETEEQAAEWLAREDRGFEGTEAALFELWLNQSTGNKVAYLRVKAAWQSADRLADVEPCDLAVSPPARVWGRVAEYRALAASALVVIGIGIGCYNIVVRQSSHVDSTPVYATRVGQQQSIHLADGTNVELNTNTRLRADVTSASRVVKLESGEAYFDVTHDAKRPFVVFAGNRKITDIGTKFSVRRNGDNVEVLVAEGRVRVDMPNARSGSRAIEAGASSIIVAQADGTLVARKSQHDIADRLSWREGMLTFDQETLATIAGEFNRYSNKHILVVGPARDLRIGGRFRPDNIDGFVSLIEEGFGLKIERTGTQIVVSE